MKAIIHCACGDMDRFSRDAFHILYPDDELPPVYGGPQKIIDFANTLPENNFSKYLKSIYRNRSRFAYYFEVDDDGNVIKQINLKSGSRVC